MKMKPKKSVCFLGEIFLVMAEQNLGRGRQQQVTCILNQMLMFTIMSK